MPGARLPRSDRTRDWERIHAEGGFAWRDVHPAVRALGESLLQAGSRTVVDVGCGIGRHAVALAQMGLRVWGCDIAAIAVRQAQSWLRQRSLGGGMCAADMTRLPFRPESFDGAVAFNVLYHGTSAQLGWAVAEIHRVLRTGGRALITFLSDEHPSCGTGTPIEPGTYVLDRGADAGIPHHFCSQAEIEGLMGGFELQELRHVERPQADVNHWVAVGVRLPGSGLLPPAKQESIGRM
jgi:SAM-dependent methyltransferase